MHVIVATFDNCDPRVWGPFPDATTAEARLDVLMRREREALQSHHCTGVIVRRCLEVKG